MFRLNLKIAWRNLLKHKGYAVINILGLALGLAGFIFMVLFINHEKSYDTWDKQLENVYQVQEYSDYYSTDRKAHWSENIDIRLGRIFLENIPETKAVTALSRVSRDHGIKIAEKPAFLQPGLVRADSLFFKVFPYKFKYGSSETAFLNPYSIVLKESLALKYFGDVDPVGRKINIASGSYQNKENPYTVTGVIKDISTPSTVDFEGIIFIWGDFLNIKSDEEMRAEVYVKTSPVKDLNFLNKTVQNAYLPLKDAFLQNRHKSLKDVIKAGDQPVLRLGKLKDIHQAPLAGKGWKDRLKPVLLLSVLLFLVSVVNFINLATAQAAGRAKEVGVRKVAGAYRRSLIYQFFTETFLQCLMALFAALLLIELSLPALNTFFSLSLSLAHNPMLLKLLLQLIVIVIVTAFLTGFYPAIFLSSFRPQQVLKGNFSNGKSGSLVKRALVGLQFVISVSFIITILMVNRQLKYLKERDNGFSPTGLINVNVNTDSKRNLELFNKLKHIDGVKNVAFSSGVLGDNSSKPYSFKFNDEVKELYTIGLGIEGLQALDARLLTGRFFSASIPTDTINNAIINESASKLFPGNMIGKTILSNDTVKVKIIGVIKDIQVEGFENAVKPTIYAIATDNYKGGVGFTIKPSTLIRFDRSKTKQVISELEKLFREENQFYPVNFSFVEEDLLNVLAEHERFEKMVAVFSFLSLALSLFGLFSLAAFITKQRTKEIAVRKVLGAENTDILVLLNKGYIWIILIANAIAFPLTYILINKWLSTFAYRISISTTPFFLAFLASVIITIITVSLQAKKTVHANPVKALKYE